MQLSLGIFKQSPTSSIEWDIYAPQANFINVILCHCGAVRGYLFVSYEYNRYVRAEVFDFGRPLLGNIFKGVWRVYGETHENDVGVGIGKRPQTIIVLLTSSVPQGKLNLKTATRRVSIKKAPRNGGQIGRGSSDFEIQLRLND